MGAAQDRVSHRTPVLPAEDVPVRRPPRAWPSLGEGGFADTTALPRDQTEDSSTRLVLCHHNSFSGDIRAVFQVMGHAAVLLSPPQSPWQQGGCCSLCLVFAPAGAPRLVRTHVGNAYQPSIWRHTQLGAEHGLTYLQPLQTYYASPFKLSQQCELCSSLTSCHE